MISISGWGRYPRISAKIYKTNSHNDLAKYLADNKQKQKIARGMGRSYGDSSLASYGIDCLGLDSFISFDSISGILHAQAGVTLDQILQTFVPKGWFLPVSPGTKFVSLGGAVACDVHGKNHHLEGSFCDYVSQISLMLGNGEITICSEENKTELFRATCGGMGLTGIILDVKLRLKKIASSFIRTTVIKTKNLQDAFQKFEQYKNSTYSVAWVDCLAKGSKLGRGIISIGEHTNKSSLEIHNQPKIKIPINSPSWLINKISIGLFNSFYYSQKPKQKTFESHYDPFFYPLDKIACWNRLYGKNGFLQYQFVVPKDSSLEAISTILEKIATSGKGSFLAVLKQLGKSNKNYLSYPTNGYTLALDFKVDKIALNLLAELDKVVIKYGGRIYLAKDSRMTEHTFKQMYPKWLDFQKVREMYHAKDNFNSLQSIRLGL